ncbi:hypothetical protein ACIQM4_32025 [Streptomyces sp. NPDC091272]|uniref:hypothetical protein n=1 Tax=Streptomyces sp. NPDC091272 TaxID=3365981 RepID=UPI0038191364
MSPRPVRPLLGAMVIGAVATLAAGCADAEELRGYGDQAELKAPLSMWATSTPSPPAPGQAPNMPTRIDTPDVPSGDMRGADALAVVKADVAASGRADRGKGTLVDPRAVAALASCRGDRCPVRPPVHHDLTGDGKPELITAVDLDGRVSELRVYTARDTQVVRILARRAVLEATEVAAGHLTVREPTSNADFVSVSEYIWDGTRMRLGGLTLDDCPAHKKSAAPCPRSEL